MRGEALRPRPFFGNYRRAVPAARAPGRRGSMQDGVDTFNAKVSMYTNTEGDYARIAVEVGYKFCFSGPLSSADQAEKVLRRFTPKVAEYWKYFEKGRKLRKELESNGKEVDGKALEDAASE